uniref:Putative secreted protein n=2 Tax=Ixodes ricinus TaxID=34613 RepID=V5H415_IXORI
MKLLLIAVVISIHTTGFLTTAQVRCSPRYTGGYGVAEGGNVQTKWTFNPGTNHCETVMVKAICTASQNCFPSESDCEENCDPTVQSWIQELN